MASDKSPVPSPAYARSPVGPGMQPTRLMALSAYANQIQNPHIASPSPPPHRMNAAPPSEPIATPTKSLEDTIVQLRAENSRLSLRLRSVEDESRRSDFTLHT